MFKASATSFSLCSHSSLSAMPSSLLTQPTPAFVKVLLTLPQVYEVALTVNRDWSGNDVLDVLKAYQRVILKAQPDKGGTNKDSRRSTQPEKRGKLFGQQGPRDWLDGAGGKQA